MTTIPRRALLGGTAAALLGACSRGDRAKADVDLWFSYGGNNRKVLLSLVRQFRKEQQKERSGVSIAATYQGDYFEGLIKLRTGLFVGTVPTVTHVVGEVIPYLAEAGVLENLEGVGADVIADLVPQLSQHGTFEQAGQRPLLALPFNRSTPIAFYNKTLFRRLGIRPPESWQEMREVARAATVRKGRITSRWGFECPIDWWFWVALVGQAGGRIIEADGRVSLGDEAGVRALSFWQTLVHGDRTMKPPPGRDYNAWEGTNSDFLAGRAAMIWTSTAFVRYLEDNAPFEVGAAPLPGLVRRSVPTGGTFFVIPRGVSPQAKQAGLKFLRWMMRPTQANAWATRTGYMPVSSEGRRRLVAEGFYRDNPNHRVSMDQLEHARPWPWNRDLFRVQRELVQPRLEEAVLAKADAAGVLAAAREGGATL